MTAKKHKPKLIRTVERYDLRRNSGAFIQRTIVTDETGALHEYAFAYIDLMEPSRDNGRILGYDNCHGVHERHFLGNVTEISFESEEAHYDRFLAEVQSLRKGVPL